MVTGDSKFQLQFLIWKFFKIIGYAKKFGIVDVVAMSKDGKCHVSEEKAIKLQRKLQSTINLKKGVFRDSIKPTKVMNI